MRRIAIVAVLLAAAQNAVGVEKFPPPEFQSPYVQPTAATPEPRSNFLWYVDVAVLAAALSLAAYLALRKRKRSIIFVVMLLSLGYFGFYRGGCVCPIGAVQNVALAVADSSYVIPVTVVLLFLLPMVFTLLFGRVFCGAVCPLGAIQDVVLVRPLKLPAWLEHSLKLLAPLYLSLAILYAATDSAFAICRYDPFVSIFRLAGPRAMVLLGASVLVVSMFVGRVFCRFLCPYAVLLRPLARVSKWRVTITPAECVQCRLCEDSCPFGAIQPPTPSRPIPRKQNKRLLGALICLLPVSALAGGWLASRLSAPLSRLHPGVQLAEHIRQDTRRREQIAASRAAAAAAYAEQGTESLARSAHERNLVLGDEWTIPAAAEMLAHHDFPDDRGGDELPEELQAFGLTRRPAAEVFDEVLGIRRQFSAGSWIVGGFMGLVIVGKLLSLTIRRRRTDYQADPADCLACGRCFEYCPVEHLRRRQTKAT